MMNVLYVYINQKCVKECTHVVSLVVFVCHVRYQHGRY